MLIHEITENLATLAKGAATALKSAPTVNKSLELFPQLRTAISHIERIASDARDPRAFDSALDRLMALHRDLYGITNANKENFRIVGEVERLRDDLQRMIGHFRSNAQQPGAGSMFLQSIQRELVPVLNDRLRSIESMLKAA